MRIWAQARQAEDPRHPWAVHYLLVDGETAQSEGGFYDVEEAKRWVEKEGLADKSDVLLIRNETTKEYVTIVGT